MTGILQLVSLLVSACTFSFAVSKAHCFRNKEFDNLLGSEVHRVPPGRVLRVMVPVLPFVVVAQLSWVVVATNGWLSSWWWCVVLAPATSLGHFERFRHSPLFLTLGDQVLCHRSDPTSFLKGSFQKSKVDYTTVCISTA